MMLPEVFHFIRKGPTSFFPVPTFWQAVAFINGYNIACCGGLLHGFREWLIVKTNKGDCLPWHAHVLYLTFPGDDRLSGCLVSPEAEAAAFDMVFQLLGEFYSERETFRGLRRIFFEYEVWLTKQYAYDVLKPKWHDNWPPPPTDDRDATPPP